MAFLFYAFVFVLFKEIGMVDHYVSFFFFRGSHYPFIYQKTHELFM